MLSSVSETAKAKINLALHVLGRRADGYHELDSIVAFANFGDQLRLEISDKLELHIDGPFAQELPKAEDNMVIKAWHVLHQHFQNLPAVKVALTKNLPIASGIGGGSADAAAMLRGLLRLMDENLSHDEIANLAKNLGADVPVCLHETACRMQGIGEIVTPLSIALPRAIVLINPLKPCSTANVFTHLGLAKGQTHLSEIDLTLPSQWRNDLTIAALSTQPAIAQVLRALQSEPAFTAFRMSGSGATCFGLVSSMAQASSAVARLSVKNPNWWVRAAELS